MAGIQSLVGGGLKSFGIDKLSENLSPQMREFLPFAMNPQGYLVGKAVNSLADYLGYGDQVRDLQAGAKEYKDYGKEIIRNTIGDALPNSIGDFVRATPRGATDTPAGTYWDPNTGSWVQSPNPVQTTDPDKFQKFIDELNYQPELSTGPHDESSQEFLNNEYDFGSEFSDYLAAPDAEAATTDYGDMFGASSGGGKLESLIQAEDEYKHGGQICGCKR